MHFHIGLAAIVLAMPALVNAAATQTQEVLRKIHLTNQLEIKLGNLAQDNANSEELRSFGKLLVVDHEAAQMKVAAVAKKENVVVTDPLPQVDGAAQKQEDAIMATLNGKKGVDFDRAFTAELDKAHRDTIASLKRSQDQLKGSSTAALIAELLPTLQTHQNMAGKQTEKNN